VEQGVNQTLGTGRDFSYGTAWKVLRTQAPEFSQSRHVAQPTIRLEAIGRMDARALEHAESPTERMRMDVGR
jgi:hypothetical protein